ncbi:MAG: NAD(P)-dependent alcohol dehydrogenase [Steroidobacteraceae bacterium]
MNVVEIRGPGMDHIARATRPEVRPLPGQVLLRMKAASLNFKDIMMATGVIPLQYPRIPLSDGVGVVAEVGEGVTRVKVGDRVCPIFFLDWLAGPYDPKVYTVDLGGAVDGVLREAMTISAQAIVKVPDYLSDEEAATLPCAGLTAWSALTTHCSVHPGQTVLIEGTGGVSIFALQFARLMGAETIVLSASDEKLERARALGAHHIVNYRQSPQWSERVLELTGGRGADVVVEVGGANTFDQAVTALAAGGHICQVGLLGGLEAKMPVMTFMRKAAHVHGIAVGSRENFEGMLRALELHRVKPVIDRRFAFEEAARAFEYLGGQSHLGKVTIQIG